MAMCGDQGVLNSILPTRRRKGVCRGQGFYCCEKILAAKV